MSALGREPSRRGVAVVTGGSAGLGRAVVREFAAAGYDVAVLARGEDGLAGAVADVAAAGRRGLGLVTDVADHQQVETAADAVEAELGPITVWVNNAMATVFAEFTRTAPEDFERATAVTYGGFVNGTRAALRYMQPRDRGVVVQVGSALAHRGIPLQAAYCGAKHAIVGFTESVVTELLHQGSSVRVCTVHMPALNTPQFTWVKNDLPAHPQPVAPIYQPEVGARAVLFAAEHPRRRMWVGVSTAATIWGNRVAAPLLDRYLARTGYDGQQSPGDERPQVGDNLHGPVPGDHGAHGRFDARSHRRSPQAWLSRHRDLVAAAALGAATAATGLAVRGRSG
ncbi:SDR family oxidoreductase [Kineococcus glutinatus]|uniref:SDR family oxidoreductase n=1 Tax=Kineococcus glutinatus TaxID=1070872 RepID=UPI0031F12071